MMMPKMWHDRAYAHCSGAVYRQFGALHSGRGHLSGVGPERIQAFSAGSTPKGAPHPGALRLLARKGIDTGGFRSKSWHEFTGPDAPPIDIAITVCGNAAQEICPVFMGAPVKAHWGLSDPADVTGSETQIDAAFEATWQALDMRVRAFLSLPLADLSPRDLASHLARIGQMAGAV